MKVKSIAALMVAGLITAACVVEGITAGAVIGFITNNATKAGAIGATVKTAIRSYKETEDASQKVRVLAEVSCYFRNNYPGEMTYLRSRLSDAGVSDKLVLKAKELADQKCPDRDENPESES